MVCTPANWNEMKGLMVWQSPNHRETVTGWNVKKTLGAWNVSVFLLILFLGHLRADKYCCP